MNKEIRWKQRFENFEKAFGLTENDVELIRKVCVRFPEIGDVEVFGSRAMGNFKPGSDVDLVVKGDGVTQRIISRLSACLNEEIPLPYKFDVLDYASIDSAKLKEHIDTVGKSLRLNQLT